MWHSTASEATIRPWSGCFSRDAGMVGSYADLGAVAP
jgi:hypothetical protein